ncbi:AraC family transcriptional regulator [Chitinophaga sp. Cy-1792]|uniref:helix-turn-helix domain-containing protein n=1 Tax=Chitinophaga sp. Cy-1792 TaxID=2608339 RepID=UPI00141DA96D|nr:helix-turn-helix domain-containing protein [Chitinophaga sp. Cy-1792]NIG55455.1 AraC family transcriptional regulator [Chitinophaga sp. Cy-1792]
MSNTSYSCNQQSMLELTQQGFFIVEIDNPCLIRDYSRKDFYKICLVTGTSLIEYADRAIEITGTTLFFGTPYIPYSWQTLSENQTGFSIYFTEQFLKSGGISESLLQSPLFKIGGTPIFFLDEGPQQFIHNIFQKMIAQQGNNYTFKTDLIRNCISLLIHEALMLQPGNSYFRLTNAAARITSLFMDLLERQFPVSAGQELQIRTPHEFADYLAVHVNHLNRAVKEVTGKPTSVHIAERIVTEARALLQNTDWPVADIAIALGFEYPTYFNNFFKKHTGKAPLAYRAEIV